MKCKNKTTKLLTVWLLVMFAIEFSLTSLDEIFRPLWTDTEVFSCFPSQTNALADKPSSTIGVISQTNSEPLARLFQILFILFIISPPIIAFMLFLIWKELKKRNELK